MNKLIGIFGENGQGYENENLDKLLNKFGIIGSLSADVGDIELYYDNGGTTYAVAKNSERYYGLNRNTMYINLEDDKIKNGIEKILTDMFAIENDRCKVTIVDGYNIRVINNDPQNLIIDEDFLALCPTSLFGNSSIKSGECRTFSMNINRVINKYLSNGLTGYSMDNRDEPCKIIKDKE